MQKLVICAFTSLALGCTQQPTQAPPIAKTEIPSRGTVASGDSIPAVIPKNAGGSDPLAIPGGKAAPPAVPLAPATPILAVLAPLGPIKARVEAIPKVETADPEYQKELVNPVITNKGIMYVPKSLQIQNTITREVECDHSLGKMEVNFNLTSEENAFVPTINICTKGDEFGTLDYKYQFNAIGRNYEYELKSSSVGGLVFEHKSGSKIEFLPLTIQRLTLKNDQIVYSCQLDTPVEKTTSPYNLCPDFAFGKLTLNPDGSTINVAFPDQPSVTIKLFEVGDLSRLAGQNFESMKRLLEDAPTEEESRKVAARMVNAVGRDAASKKLYFDLLKGWKDAKSGREDVYYEALCSVGASESIKVVMPLFASNDCNTLFHAVAPLCRVAQSEAVDTLVLSAIEKAYPKSNNFDCKSVVSYGLSYFAKPSQRTLTTLRALSKTSAGSGFDIEWYLRNFPQARRAPFQSSLDP